MVRKQDIFSFALLWGSLLTGGCVSTVDEPAADAVPISFAAAVTRAAVDADKNGMENFLVWGGFNNANNLFNAETVTPAGHYQGTRYWVPGETHNFYVLHPAGLTEGTTDNKVAQRVECTDAGTITVTGFDTSLKRGTEAIDLMTASKTDIHYATRDTPYSVDLTFGHELSRVRFTIKTDADVSISDVRLSGITYKGDFSTKPDAASPWSNPVTAAEADTPFSQTDAFALEAGGSRNLLAGIPDPNNENYGDLLLIPQAFPQTPELSGTAVFSMTWTYKANGASRTVEVPLWQAGPDQWEKGKSYRYSATIPEPATDITFTVTVSDWNDQRIDADL